MNKPWMPLHIGDYKRDTGHLNAAQHGAYLLLIMHYWTAGSLPDDEDRLARIACMTKAEWKRHRFVLAALFLDGWKHKRVEFELSEAARLSNAGRAGGLASGKARRSRIVANDRSTISERSANDLRTIVERSGQRLANDQPTICEALKKERREDTSTVSSLRSETSEGAARPKSAEETDLFRRGKAVLGTNAGGLIARLMKAKGSVELARAAIETAATKQDPKEYIGAVLRGEADTQRGWDPRL